MEGIIDAHEWDGNPWAAKGQQWIPSSSWWLQYVEIWCIGKLWCLSPTAIFVPSFLHWIPNYWCPGILDSFMDGRMASWKESTWMGSLNLHKRLNILYISLLQGKDFLRNSPLKKLNNRFRVLLWKEFKFSNHLQVSKKHNTSTNKQENEGFVIKEGALRLHFVDGREELPTILLSWWIVEKFIDNKDKKWSVTDSFLVFELDNDYIIRWKILPDSPSNFYASSTRCILL